MQTITKYVEYRILVDDEDWPIISKFSWHIIKNKNSKHRDIFYAASTIKDPVTGKRRGIRMHQLIMGFKDGFIPDHINGNGLDNRRENLRFATSSQNSANAKPSGGKSRYKGVCLRKTGQWQASICVEGKRKHIGLFRIEEDAARAYDREALNAWGEFARINFPE